MYFPQLPHSKLRGEWAEVYFMQEAMARGFVVAKPYGDSQKYDLIVEFRGVFSRVQVRSCFRKLGNRYPVKATQGKKSQTYSISDLDFLAACAVPKRSWYIIPVRETGDRGTILLGSHSLRSNFEKFRDAWHLLMPRSVVVHGTDHLAAAKATISGSIA